MSSQPIDLIAIGFIVGAIGTLIGAGGGFLLVPILLLLDPHMTPDVVTGISLAVIFFNAASGSVAYARMGRIVYKAGIIFALAALPGAIIGVYTTSHIPRTVFNGIFGCLMIAASVYLMTTSETKTEEKQLENYNLGLGAGISVVIGFLSSVLGIGGGIIHVPALTRILNFPVHIATATSHFVLSNYGIGCHDNSSDERYAEGTAWNHFVDFDWSDYRCAGGCEVIKPNERHVDYTGASGRTRPDRNTNSLAVLLISSGTRDR
jgi:uncharacterized membrane protein YfcA